MGVTKVYGIDAPRELEIGTRLAFFKEHAMTPVDLINELKGMERFIFRKVFGGSISRKMYRLYEYIG